MLTRIAAVAMMALVTSGGAAAQTPSETCLLIYSLPAKASREFVENYAAALHALSENRHSDAVARADAAAPYAANAQQLQVLFQIKAVSYGRLGDKANLAANIAAARALGCLSEPQLKQLQQM